MAEGGQVCYRTDHHLTSLGNCLHLPAPYQIDQGRAYLSRDAYQVTATDGFYGTTLVRQRLLVHKARHRGDLVDNIQTKVTLRDGSADPIYSDSLYFPKHLEEIDKYPVFLDGNHSLVNISNPSAEEGSVLVIRDSYAHCFSTFLAANYQSIYLVDLRYYRDDLTKFVSEHRVDKILYLYAAWTTSSATRTPPGW
ncbi:MAG: DHHW family protein [Evtepia sp.]